jgi:hypothetical protein
MRRSVSANTQTSAAKECVERGNGAPLAIRSSDVKNRICKVWISQSRQKSGHAFETESPRPSGAGEQRFEGFSIRRVGARGGAGPRGR